MKTTIAILTIAALAAAAPKPTKLQFRNAFKHPIEELQPKPSPRVVGGQEATPHSLPYQVYIEILTDEDGSGCGGSLISANYILTAAHCLYFDKGSTAHVTLGAHKLSENEPTQVVVDSDSFVIHNRYLGDFSNDIALIKLPASVIFTDAIRPVALPKSEDSEKLFVGEVGRISGWGFTDGSATNKSDVLNYVDVEVITNEDCERYYFSDLPASVLCTSGDPAAGPCDDDSGGPLVLDGVQIGVVAFIEIACTPGYPAGSTRITSFMDWISEHSDV